MMMTTVIKHKTLDPNRTKPCDDKTKHRRRKRKRRFVVSIVRAFQRRSVNSVFFFNEERLLEWRVKMSTQKKTL